MTTGQKPSPNPWQYASLGTQLAITLLIFIYAGYKLDQWKHSSPTFTVFGAVVGIVIGLYNFLRSVLKK